MKNTKSFPAQKLPMSKKTQAWKEACVDYVVGAGDSGFGGNGRSRSDEMQTYYDLYNSIYNEKDLKYVTNPFKQDDGFPAMAQDYNIIKPYVDQLLGEETKRPFNFHPQRTSDIAASELQEKAKEVIDGADNGTYYYKLLPEYSQVYSWEYNNKNTELLLGIYYNRDAMGQAAPLTDFLQDMKQAGWGDTNGEIKFWKNFPEGPRKDATYFPKIMLSDGKLYDWWYDTDPASREVVAPVFMKTAEGAVRGTEFDYTNPTVVNASGEKTFQLLRLSQVYCWYAEATGRAGEINDQAVKVLNEVRNRADGEETDKYTTDMSPDKLAEAAYDEHGWEMAGYYWGGIASRARDMFRMYRYKDHFESRKLNEPIEVAHDVFRKEAVAVTGTWDDSKMYVPYPYEDVILNPNLDNSWKN